MTALGMSDQEDGLLPAGVNGIQIGCRGDLGGNDLIAQVQILLPAGKAGIRAAEGNTGSTVLLLPQVAHIAVIAHTQGTETLCIRRHQQDLGDILYADRACSVSDISIGAPVEGGRFLYGDLAFPDPGHDSVQPGIGQAGQNQIVHIPVGNLGSRDITSPFQIFHNRSHVLFSLLQKFLSGSQIHS